MTIAVDLVFHIQPRLIFGFLLRELCTSLDTHRRCLHIDDSKIIPLFGLGDGSWQLVTVRPTGVFAVRGGPAEHAFTRLAGSIAPRGAGSVRTGSTLSRRFPRPLQLLIRVQGRLRWQ